MSSAPTPRPPRDRPIDNRDSLLRASILESALELGVGSSRTVTNWIFSPVDEGDEEEYADTETTVSPSLTYASTATSDDSFLSNTFANKPQPGAGILLSSGYPSKPFNAAGSSISSMEKFSRNTSTESSQKVVFDVGNTPELRAMSPTLPGPKSSPFRRLRRGGNESDGGYVTDGGNGKRTKEKKKDKQGKSGGTATDYESDGGYFSETPPKGRKKIKKEKKGTKDSTSYATDYETDSGVGATRNKKQAQRPRKGSLLSPVTADESDGGNLSETSGKRKGFFRLNTRSRKKKDSDDSPRPDVPPVPTLPPAMLPIAERFLRSPTPNPAEGSSRTATPVSIQPSVTDRESMISATSTEHERRAGSMISREGLTKAFRDARSVHRPSIDALATFRNMAPMPSSPSPLKTGTTSAAGPGSPQSLPPSSPEAPDVVPSISPPKIKGTRPIISAPNTSLLAAKHVPVPLVLNSPTSIRSHAAQQFPSSPEGSYMVITPLANSTHDRSPGVTPPPMRSPARPDSDFIVPSPSKQSFSSNTSSQSTLRPHVLAYYAVPPPTPPPQGPLPDVPSPFPASSSPSPASHMPTSHLQRTVSADDIEARGVISSTRNPATLSPAGPAPVRRLPSPPISAPTHTVRSASDSDVMHPTKLNTSVPLISEPVPKVQRGRVSPFPTSLMQPGQDRGRISPFPVSPIAPRAESSGLVRKFTNMMSSSPKANKFPNQPISADGYSHRGSWRDPGKLDIQWQPRSASALERPRPDAFHNLEHREEEAPASETVPEDDVSELEVGDDNSDYLAEGSQEHEDERSVYPDDDRPPTMYEGSDAGDANSIWSQSDGRRSFFDEERSASARERFVKQVEAMYGEYKIPPVPPLNVPKAV